MDFYSNQARGRRAGFWTTSRGHTCRCLSMPFLSHFSSPQPLGGLLGNQVYTDVLSPPPPSSLSFRAS